MASFYNTRNDIMKLLSKCCQTAVKMLLNYCVLHPLPIHLFLK